MTIDFITSISIVGAVASIVGLLLPAPGWRSKLTHVAYGMIVTFLAVGVTYSQGEISELRKIEVQARMLADSQRRPSYGDNDPAHPGYSDRGFMLAGLAFLEKYKNRFPDTYIRAKTFSEISGVLQPINSATYTEQQAQRKRLDDGARAMRALLEGLASGGLN
jgi:hypothetical protein